MREQGGDTDEEEEEPTDGQRGTGEERRDKRFIGIGY